MDPVLTALIAGILGAAVGFGLGRGSGRSAGLESGRVAGLREGKAEGLEEGTSAGLDEGRRLGRDEGHSEGRVAGFEEGRNAGLEEGRRAGLEEGRRAGLEEGRKAGLEEGRRAGLEEGRTSGFREGRTAGLTEGRAEYGEALRSVIESVARGRAPENLEAGSAEAELHAALSQGWAPREVEREAAMREAVSRVSGYLGRAVREPLSGADEGADAEELRERIERALGALQDLDFFIEEIEEHREGQDLVKLAQTVSREFAADHDVGVRLLLEHPSVHAAVNGPALLDALYLVLHNAARFGGGSTVDITVAEEGGRARLTVRDRGEGFSEEAFARAFDPFYSTSNAGLGLGLPHARKVIEGMGGHIELRNVPDGGAEVEISFTAS
jgi:signal transduction histidine kinase